MRKVKFSRRVFEIIDGKREYKTEYGVGVFHQWGCSYEEFDTGPGNYTVGIVELPGGEVILLHPELIVFIGEDFQDA